LMQLVRVAETGMDADGDGTADLDPSRIYFVGASFGGQIGTPFLAVEPSIRVAALNVTAGSGIDSARLAALNRAAVGTALAERVPALLNAPGVVTSDGAAVGAPYFDENLPLRDGVPLSVGLADGTSREIRSPVVNTVAGALAIQQAIENAEWARMSSYALAYAPHLHR